MDDDVYRKLKRSAKDIVAAAESEEGTLRAYQRGFAAGLEEACRAIRRSEYSIAITSMQQAKSDG